MLAKAVFAFFAQVPLIQSALGQVCGRSAFAGSTYGLAGSTWTSPFGNNVLPTGRSGSGLACDGLAYNVPAIEIIPTTGGALRVTSVSAPERSLIVASENVYEGTLSVEGELPFVGTVGLEGVMPSAGTGAVNHACGNGAIRMISQDGAAVSSGFGTGLAPVASLAPGSLYGGIGAFGNSDALASYDSGLAGLTYPNSGLVGAYPINGFAGAYHGASVFAPAATYGGAIAPGAAYGGSGEGNVAVAGELPVTGNTAVAGQVPIMGVVRFDGMVPAAGTVVISGKCSCGCRNPYVY